MRLLLFLLLSISNGNNQSNGDVGVTVERQSLKERTRDGRSVIAFLKPWVLELINSRARDDRTYKYHFLLVYCLRKTCEHSLQLCEKP